ADGLTEALYLLFAIAAVGCGAAGLRKRSTAFLLASGICTGFAYLVRPEGVVLAVGVGLTVAAMVYTKAWPARLAIARLTPFAVGAMIPAAPYMALIGGVTTKPTGVELLQEIQGGPKAKLYPGQTARLGGKDALFASWYTDRDGAKVLWSGKAVGQEVTKGFH